MQDISTTLKGRIGSEPMMKHVKGDVCVTTFRLAITRWRFVSDVRTGNASYVEDGAYWYTVETWDTLASNVFRSCRKGDPVVVVARPVQNGWIDGNGQIRSSIVYRAYSVGHDLARGTSQFTKNGSHSTDEPAGGTQGDPYSTRQGPGSAVMAHGDEHQGDLGTDVHTHAVMPNDGTDLLPDDAAPSQSEPTPTLRLAQWAENSPRSPRSTNTKGPRKIPRTRVGTRRHASTIQRWNADTLMPRKTMRSSLLMATRTSRPMPPRRMRPRSRPARWRTPRRG